MIVYLDTSAFLKLYLEESNSALVREVLDRSAAVYTHLITYAEMRAALAQGRRMNRISRDMFPAFVEQFEDDWLCMQTVTVDMPLVRRAGGLAERFGLRGFDSVHLASAEKIYEVNLATGAFVFAAFDKSLCAAAETLGIETLP